MSRRIEIELTSSKEDGSWTWRAAGARQPKGVVAGGLLPAGSEVGSVLRADVDTTLDGTTVLAVLPPKGARAEPERIELVGRADPEEWVTTTLAPKGRGRRDDRDDRGDRGDRRPRGDRNDRGPRPGGDRGGRPGGDRPGGDRPGGDRQPGGPRGERPAGDRRPRSGEGDRRPRDGAPTGGPRGPRREKPAVDSRPKAKRLKAGRAHRRAVLDELPVEHRPVAEQVLKGGIPAVRTAVEKQNEQARAEGQTEVKADQLVDLAEKLLPRLRAAEWRDRADAALADITELDLRDLRSVIVAADTAAKDEESRAIAASLRDGLAVRVEQEQSAWLAEIASTLAEGRIVRALSLTSRPPKAGTLLPADLTERLVAAAVAALTSDTPSNRWATVLDALSYSPIHLKVLPTSIPAEPDEALLTAVRTTSARLPQIAALFGIEPTAAPPERRRGQRPGGGGGGGGRPGQGPKKPKAALKPPPPPAVADTPMGAAPVEAAPAPPDAAEAAPVESAPAAPDAAETAPIESAAADSALPEAAPPASPEAEAPPAVEAAPEPAPEPAAAPEVEAAAPVETPAAESPATETPATEAAPAVGEEEPTA